MPDNYRERVEAQWQSEIGSLKRLTDIRGELRETEGTYFDFTSVNEAIGTKIRDLHGAAGGREWNDITEADILSDMETLVAIRKTLAGSSFPHLSELQDLGELINKLVTHTHWEQGSKVDGC